MREYQLRTDLERAVVDGFAFPLGIVPRGGRPIEVPTVGYTLDYTPGEEDEPDTYAFHIVLSHERLAGLVDRAFGLLPDEVHGILEIGSRDAYRALDVYMGQDPISIDEFCAAWEYFEAFLLEDGSIGCGANSEEPFIEVFLDQWKGLSIHVPLSMRETVEQMLHTYGLREVQETWPEWGHDGRGDGGSHAARERGGEQAPGIDVEALTDPGLRGGADPLAVRSVLALDDEFSPGLDEMVLQLRHAWHLELNIDPDKNVDDSGRAIGRTLWHAMVLVEATERPRVGGYASIWATAGSLAEMESLIAQVLDEREDWRFEDIYTIDRVAFDERPDELADLPPRRLRPEVHLVEFES